MRVLLMIGNSLIFAWMAHSAWRCQYAGLQLGFMLVAAVNVALFIHNAIMSAKEG